MDLKEFTLKELCAEVAKEGVQTDRFLELWLASEINLDQTEEFTIANKILQKSEQEILANKSWDRNIH